MIKVAILLSLAVLASQSADSKSIGGRFVASDSFQGLTNPREPIQRLIVEVLDKNSSSDRKLLRVVYFPETNGRRGGAKFLRDDQLTYKNVWTLRVYQPKDQREKAACGQFDNFLRSYDGAIDTDGKEPLLRYHSTQFDAEIKFVHLTEITCMILDSMSK